MVAAPPDPRFDVDLALLANRLPDREARVEELFLRAASLLPDRTFLLAGNGWADKPVPANVRVLGHVGTADHNAFNSTPLAVANVTRDSMVANGWYPATRVFEVAGAAGRRYALGRSMIRIGREDDNDIQLPLATVHRYHAVLHRTPEAEYVITDLSSANGNGLIVNGRRLAEARLRDGDTVQLGEATLTFTARPA